MAKLSDTSSIILSAAAARDNHRVLPLPKLKAPPVVVHKTLISMLTSGLIEEIAATRDDEAWEQSDAKGRTALIINTAGLAAVGIDAETTPAKPPKGRTRGQNARSSTKAAKSSARAPVGSTGNGVSKQDAVIALLRRANGASVKEIMEATDWQAHSVRGFMSGTLKKRLGIGLTSEKTKAGERRYHVAPIK